MKDITVVCFPLKTPYLEKFWPSSYMVKWSLPIRLQDFLVTNISGRDNLDFALVNIHQRKLATTTSTFGWV